MDISACFSSNYVQARLKFVEAAQQIGLRYEPHWHPELGQDGEALSMDVVRDDPHGTHSLLVITSGCHGVEGFCGSAVQVALLRDTEWRRRIHSAGVAVLYIHALNPHGFSWVRRVTHENVDLNRNFQDFSKPLPANEAYAQIHNLLLPETWPPDANNQKAVDAYIAQHGVAALQAAVTRGQYEFPDGLFYGGKLATWSNVQLRQTLRHHGVRAKRLAWIDLHSGLGPRGAGERIFACKDEAAALARARAWWGSPVTSIYDGSSTSTYLTGLMWMAAYEECPKAEYTGIALEYGTVPMPDVMMALRADHWLHKHPRVPAPQRAEIKQQVREAFYVDANDWKEQVIEQAREAAFQAVDGLTRH